jgi:hypothetical protein
MWDEDSTRSMASKQEERHWVRVAIVAFLAADAVASISKKTVLFEPLMLDSS